MHIIIFFLPIGLLTWPSLSSLSFSLLLPLSSSPFFSSTPCCHRRSLTSDALRYCLPLSSAHHSFVQASLIPRTKEALERHIPFHLFIRFVLVRLPFHTPLDCRHAPLVTTCCPSLECHIWNEGGLRSTSRTMFHIWITAKVEG